MNMKKLFLIKSTLLSALVFSSIAHANELSGTWSSICASDGSGKYNIETFEFSEHTAIYAVKTYSDAKCSQKISTLQTYRNYELGKPVTGLPQTRKLTYTFKSVTMAYNDPAAVKAASQAKDYGFDNWVLNSPKEVAKLKRNTSTEPEHYQGEKFYTIVKIEKDRLYMGDYASGKGDSEATRLSQIYKVPFLKEEGISKIRNNAK